MDLSLSNSLVGGGSMNPDGLSLDLQFAADKTLTARRGPTPVFSRGSSGTFVNANGLIVGKTTATTTSITPTSIPIGQQIFVIVPSGSVAGWVVGQPISLIVDTDGQDDPDVNELWLLGNIVSTTYVSDSVTLLTFEVTARSTQSGSASSWTLGYRGPRFDHDPVGKTNLLTRSQEFNLSPWGTNNAMTVTPDATIAPDGTLTADAINFDTNSTSRIIYLAGSAVVHTFSVWLRADTNRTCIIATAANASANIDVVANVTTTWQRFSVVASNWSPSTSSFNVRIANNATGTSGTIFAWGAQLEAGSTATNYIPTTTAPVTIRDCKGLLIEEGRINLYQQSEVFDNSFWTKTRSSITADATTAPDGTLTADKFVEDTTPSDTHTLGSTVTPPATAHTLSVFAKKGERTWIVLRLGGLNTFFNLDDGTIAAGSANASTITNFGNGWYRCAVTNSFGTQGSFQLATNSTTTSYTGDGTSGIFIWGAQLEAGAFPTSYIPTTTGSVARSADVCSITGSAFTGMYNATEGTLISGGSIASLAGSNRGMWGISNNTSSHGFLTYYDASLAGVATQSRNTTTTPLLPTFANSANTSFKRGLAYYTGGGSISTNGASVTNTTATISTQTMLALHIGSMNLGVLFYWSGHISSIRYYRKRLPNAKLQSLTAP